jgi:hypothetical protein
MFDLAIDGGRTHRMNIATTLFAFRILRQFGFFVAGVLLVSCHPTILQAKNGLAVHHPETKRAAFLSSGEMPLVQSRQRHLHVTVVCRELGGRGSAPLRIGIRVVWRAVQQA